MLHVPTHSETEYAKRHRDFHASISARAAKISTPLKSPYVPKKYAIDPTPYWRDMWCYDLVRCGETYVPGPTRIKRIDIRKIQEVVAKHYDVKVADILSNRRTADVIMPRHVAMYLAKELTGKSLPELGKRFAGRDHTTILSATQKIDRLMKVFPELAQTVSTLSQIIKDETL